MPELITGQDLGVKAFLSMEAENPLGVCVFQGIATIRKVRGGEVPEGWTGKFECANCGPVFLLPGGPKKILGCPWCINKAEGLPIPKEPEAQHE